MGHLQVYLLDWHIVEVAYFLMLNPEFLTLKMCSYLATDNSVVVIDMLMVVDNIVIHSFDAVIGS